MNKVLIIDDEEKIRNLLSRIINLEGFEVLTASDGKTGLRKIEQHDVDIIICDVKLPDGSGVELSRTIKEKYPAKEIILLTAFANIPDSVQAIKNGAFDYISKGDDNNRIIPLLYKAAEKTALNKKLVQLERELGNKYSLDRIIGSSRSIRATIESAKKVAVTDATVLLTGETGTGKEVFAQSIHRAGRRASKKFTAINCSAFSKELLENELFGHKAGAYTGAVKDSKGIFEESDGGTVFLDEIGEMPLELQAKLLRVLETGEFLKVGDNKNTRVDVRIIAATNRDLQKEIEKGKFREDLYYRISVFVIQLPSLRERLDDIEELARYFVAHYAGKVNKRELQLSDSYIDALKIHQWKGNVRELKNVIERSVILTDGPVLLPETLPNDFISSHPYEDKTMSAFDLASAEKIHIQKVLNYTRGNKTEAARLLNIALTTLYRKLEEYKIG